MKTRFTLLLFFVLDVLSAQGVLTPVWSKFRTSPLSGGQAEAWAVDVDAAGYVYWPVSFDSTSADKKYDNVYYKFDASGNLQWQNFYVNTGIQHAFIANAKDTFLYVGGRNCPALGSECDMIIQKINKASGGIVKTTIVPFGIHGYDEMDAIEPRSDAIYCGGWCQMNGGIGDYEMGFVKLDYNLDTLQTAYFGNNVSGSAEHQDGHFVVDNNFIYGAGLWNGHTGFNNLTDGRAQIGKFNRSDLSYVDTTQFGPALAAAGDLQNALGTTSDGTYLYVTGYAQPTSIFDMQLFLAKFDKNLNLIWERYFGGSDGETARAIAVQNGIVYLGGATKSAGYTVGGAYDALLVQYDTAGNFLNYRTYGDSKDNEIRDLALDGSFIYLSGTSGVNMFNLGGSSDEGFLLKVDLTSISTGIDAATDKIPDLRLFPNPANERVSVHWTQPAAASMVLQVLDVLGRVVYSESLGMQPVGANNYSFQVSELTAGSYVCRLSCADWQLCSQLVLSR